MVGPADAARLSRAGACDCLSSHQALALLEYRVLPMPAVRRFVQQTRAVGVPLRDLSDANVLKQLRQAIKAGCIVALRAGRASAQEKPKTTVLRALVRQVEQALGPIADAGRQYRLVVDVDLASLPGRDGYEVVPRADASRVLESVEKQSATKEDLAALLARTVAELSKDWHPPFQPDGLVLVRRIPIKVSDATPDTPALTPSQLQKLRDPKDSWIKVHLIHAETGEAIDGASLHLKLPSTQEASAHATDDDGVVDLTEQRDGTFSIEHIDDEDVWELVSHEES